MYVITDESKLANNKVVYPGQVVSKDKNATNLFALWNRYPSDLNSSEKTTEKFDGMYNQALIGNSQNTGLAQEIDKRCALIGKTMDILLEVNIADEANKSGFGYDDIPNAVEEIRRFEHLKLRGFMTIGRFGAEIEETRGYFKKMHALLVDIRSKKIDNKDISILSMGMSGDYMIAVQEGATVVRVGRGLFGERKSVL